MKIGYPCINHTLTCQGNQTFRLKSYSIDNLKEKVENNLDCLQQILKYNLRQNILFFRITSDLVPFASHPINRFDWQEFFRKKLRAIGQFIKRHDMRISMHPDQFTLINSLDRAIFQRSLKELLYHAEILDSMKLNTSAKIQIHVGGVYNDKTKSIKRFITRYKSIDDRIKRRLVIENDDKSYCLRDCLLIHEQTQIPIVFDIFHHSINNAGEELEEAFALFTKTWQRKDGLPMVDYSHQKRGSQKGHHASSLNKKTFKNFLAKTKPYDFDIMLEIKDKEKSAVNAVQIASGDARFRSL